MISYSKKIEPIVQNKNEIDEKTLDQPEPLRLPSPVFIPTQNSHEEVEQSDNIMETSEKVGKSSANSTKLKRKFPVGGRWK